MSIAVELPEIATGTPKQRSWAQDIRNQAVTNLGDRVNGHAVNRVLSELTDARWWIDNRHDVDRQIRILAGPTDADHERGRAVTQRLLDLHDHEFVHDPTWRPRTGTRRPEPLQLRGDAARAYRMWQSLTGRDPLGVLDRSMIRAWIDQHAETPAGELMRTALAADGGRQLDLIESTAQGWELARRLHTQHDQLDPATVYHAPAQPERCRHGRLFTEDCSECDNEF